MDDNSYELEASYGSTSSEGDISQLNHMEFFQEPSLIKLNSHQSQQEIVNIQKPLETHIQFFQLTEENSICKICYKYAINGMLCNNEKCSVLICGNCSIEAIKKIQNKCPFCRIQPFNPLPSPFRTVINKMEHLCTLCHDKYILEEEQNHYKKECLYFKKIQCRFCPQKLQKNQLVKHIRICHQDKLDDIIQNMYERPDAIYNPKQLININSLYLNKINKAPQLGTTGKFYCGGRLQPPKCTCCNGFCGPSNGQNCAQCMRLDIKRFGLPKGHLVNSSGNVCWKEGDAFVCNAMVPYQQTYCREENSCRSCSNMRKNIKRYQELL